MKPFLSILFVNNDREYRKALMESNELVELISLNANEHLTEEEILNNLVSMAHGDYVSIIRSCDTLINGFTESILSALGSRRDCIIFQSVDGNGHITKYTSITKKYNLSPDNPIKHIQYFHAIKRRLIKGVMFYTYKDQDLFEFFSRRMANTVFSEKNINEVLIQHDNI